MGFRVAEKKVRRCSPKPLKPPKHPKAPPPLNPAALNPTYRFMGTCNHNDKSTFHLLRGLWELISTVIIGARSTLNLQVNPALRADPDMRQGLATSTLEMSSNSWGLGFRV